jgi:RNA polymerase sigma-70 factor (ECF subfamily)
MSMTKTPTSLLERLHQPFAPEAWDRFVALYTPVICAWARHVTFQEQDAVDLVQDVFLKLIQVLPTFQYDARKGFRRWLRAVTLNTWRDRNKRRGDRPLPGNDKVLAQVAAPDGFPSFWDVEYRQHVVNRALALMQEDFRPATWKAFWEQVVVGRPASEVASELGLSQAAAYAAKFRVLGRLRDELQGMLN